MHKNNWAEDRVFFFADDGQMRSLPASWTDVAPPDPFVVLAAGRGLFRVADLMALADLLDGLGPAGRKRGVKKIPPKRKGYYAETLEARKHRLESNRARKIESFAEA